MRTCRRLVIATDSFPGLRASLTQALPPAAAWGVVLALVGILVVAGWYRAHEPLPGPGERHHAERLGVSLLVPEGWHAKQVVWGKLITLGPIEPRGGGAWAAISVSRGEWWTRPAMRGRLFDEVILAPIAVSGAEAVDVVAAVASDQGGSGHTVTYSIRYPQGEVIEVHAVHMIAIESLAGFLPQPGHAELHAWAKPVVESLLREPRRRPVSPK